ncbi:MAG: helix-turn-helix transcriptional regulator [Thermoleophilia bacterium]|nr:helix-turn-helix transcriptional regulator [Thermoleophilia bacterium]
MNGPGGGQRRRRGGGPGGGPGGRGPGAGGARGFAGETAIAALAGSGFGEQKRSLIETALLIALMEQSRHGYALIERVQELVGDQLYVDAGSVYRILRLLEEAGMVTSAWEAGVAGPQRRTYTVEAAGRELLASWATVLRERGEALLALSRLAQTHLT